MIPMKIVLSAISLLFLCIGASGQTSDPLREFFIPQVRCLLMKSIRLNQQTQASIFASGLLTHWMWSKSAFSEFLQIASSTWGPNQNGFASVRRMRSL